MELLQLQYFLEVAGSQHMTRSAERLHISQPSLSQAMRRLEAELGVPLFERSGRNIVLTEYGVFLRERLEPLMRRLDALPEQMREMADAGRTTIRLHVTAASLLVSEAIIAYRREHENVHFQFLLGEDDSLFDLRVESRLTLPASYEGRDDVFTCNEKIHLAVPRRSAWYAEQPVPLRRFERGGFISLIANKQFRQLCDELCAQAGFHPRVVFESDNPDTVRNMIAANMGIGFWPAFTWGRLGEESVALLEISEPVCSRRIVIRMQKNRVDNRIVADFFGFLCDFFAEKMYEAYGL